MSRLLVIWPFWRRLSCPRGQCQAVHPLPALGLVDAGAPTSLTFEPFERSQGRHLILCTAARQSLNNILHRSEPGLVSGHRPRTFAAAVRLAIAAVLLIAPKWLR